MLMTRIGVDAEVRFLRDVVGGAYELVPLVQDDMERCCELVERYRDLEIGLADASVVVLAARHRTTRILTLDERHFRALRPLRGKTFKLLPTDG